MVKLLVLMFLLLLLRPAPKRDGIPPMLYIQCRRRITPAPPRVLAVRLRVGRKLPLPAVECLEASKVMVHPNRSLRPPHSSRCAARLGIGFEGGFRVRDTLLWCTGGGGGDVLGWRLWGWIKVEVKREGWMYKVVVGRSGV
jgi:hypothetical protein